MSAPWIVAGAVALAVAAFWLGRFLRRLWRHTGQRVDRLADPAPMPGDLHQDPYRHIRPAPPVWAPQITDRFPAVRREPPNQQEK